MIDKINRKIKEIVKVSSIRIASAALAVNMLLSYAIDDVLLDFTSILVAFLAVAGTAYIVGMILKKLNYINVFIMGAISYFAYVWVLVFFKLIENPPIFEEQLQASLIFGAITIATYWAIDNFG